MSPSAIGKNGTRFFFRFFFVKCCEKTMQAILTVENIYGDVNGDGDVNMTDLNAVINDVLKDQRH